MLCTLFHSLLSSLRKSFQPLHLKSLLWWYWYRILTPLLLLSGAACCGKRRVRSLGFLVTVLPLACWGTTEKLLGLFGLSFLLCKVRGVGTWSPALSDQPSWEQRCNEHLSMPPDSVPGAEEQPTTQENPTFREGFHFSVECSPLPLPLKSPPRSFLKQFSLHSLHFFTLQLFSNSCKPCSCFNHSPRKNSNNAAITLCSQHPTDFYLVFILPALYVEGNTFMIFFFYQQSSTAHFLLKMTTSFLNI